MAVADDAVIEDSVIRVSPTTPTNALGNAIYREWLNTGEFLPVRAIGVGAVNQACKGMASASVLVAGRGRTLAFTVGFDTVEGDNGESLSALTWYPFLR